MSFPACHSQVFDVTPPMYPARDGIKACLWPNNKLWKSFSDIALNNLFFGSMNDSCSGRNVTGTLVGCSTSLKLSRSTTKGIDTTNCQYNSATRVLKLKALRALSSTDKFIHNIVWRVRDECGNSKDYVAGIVVAPSFTSDVYTEYYDTTQKIWDVKKTSAGTKSTTCIVADLAS